MQEFDFDIKVAESRGLAPHPYYPPGSPFAKTMRNARPSEYGAINPEWFTCPFAFTLDWPFPQVVRGENVTLLFKRASVSTLDGGWSETAITPKRSTATGSNATVVGGGVWHTATFEDVWFATNGASFLFNEPAHDHVLMADGLTAASVCAAEDRLFVVSPAGTWFSGARFQQLFDTWRRTRRAFAHDQMAWSPRWVIWGERRGGAADVPFSSLLTAMGVFGDAAFDALEGEFLTKIEQGEIGFASVRSPGTPLVAAPLGDRVVVYSQEGRFVLSPEQGGPGYYGAGTKGAGAINRGALSASPFQHAWITPSRKLNAQPVGGELVELRQNHRFTGSLTNLVGSYDNDTIEHWFATENWAYVLNRWGLGGPFDIRPTSLCRANGALIGPGIGLDTTEFDVSWYSHRLDMGYQGSKTITVVEAELLGINDLLIDVEAAAGLEDPFSIGAVQANALGVGGPKRSGNTFHVGIKGKAPRGGSYAISNLTVRYQAEDRRFRRGASSPAANS